jgi:hypothetical protein
LFLASPAPCVYSNGLVGIRNGELFGGGVRLSSSSGRFGASKARQRVWG